MSERDADEGSGGARGGTSRDRKQALVAAALVVGLLTAAAMMPAVAAPFGSGPGSGSESGGENPGKTSTRGGQKTPGPGSPGEGSASVQPGALNPGARTDVGGAIRSSEAGGLGNLSNAVHFVVTAERASYWRTGAYGRYTGSGWERQRNPDVYTGGYPGEGERLVQRVRLLREATALPGAWKPTAVEFVNDTQAQLYVTPRRSFVVRSGVPAGTTYRIVSHLKPKDPSLLRQAGSDYPDSVMRYTRLPRDTPERVSDFTDRLTSEADNAYETARVIELWLENEKRYSLNASHDPSRPVADQFIFEMEKGYCEYFATSMVVMLRSQDIPARYVVGYAPGKRTGENTYEVRSMDAHAWVEVYFPDVGWVRFDPTPAASRRANEREGMKPGEGGNRPVVPGSPGDTRPDGGIPGIDDLPGNVTPKVPDIAPDRVPAPPYEVRLNESPPVPGSFVTATVTKAGRPVEGVVVTFDGEAVGRTNRNGNVTARVPYVENLTVEARLPEGVEPNEGTGTRATFPARYLHGIGLGLGLATPATPGAGKTGFAVGRGLTTPEGDDDSGRTYDVETGVALSVEGVFAPGRTAKIVATIDGVPVRNARVTIAGESVGRTDERGVVVVQVPESLRGNVEVGVRRGEIAATTTLELANLQVSLAPDTVLALPGQGATVTVTVGDRPVRNARVFLDGQAVGTTDRQGRVHVQLPVANGASVRAEGPVLSTTLPVSGLFLNLGLLLAFVASALVGAGVYVRRNGPDAGAAADRFGTLVANLGTLLAKLARRTVDGAVATVILAGRGLHALAGATRRGIARVGTAIAGFTRRITAVSYTALAVRVARGVYGAVARSVRGIGRWIRYQCRRLKVVVVGTLPWVDRSELDYPERPRPSAKRDDGVVGTSLSVREAWRSFVRMLRLRRPRTMTPGEIARAAVEKGFPERAVSRLTDAFRAVEYGGENPDGRTRERATEALDRVQGDASDRRTSPGGDD